MLTNDEANDEANDEDISVPDFWERMFFSGLNDFEELDEFDRFVKLGGLDYRLRQAVFREQDEENRRNPLHFACKYSASLEVIKFIVDAGGRDLIKQQDKHGMTPLYCACYSYRKKPSLAVVKYLVEKGGKEIVNEKDKNGKYPLHYACEYGASLDVIEFLVDANQEVGREVVTEQDVDGWNALHYACAYEDGTSFDVIKFLVDKGGKEAISQQDKHGRTPLVLAHECDAPLNVIVYLVLAGGKSVYGGVIGGSQETKSGNPKLEIRNILLSLWNASKMSGIEKLTDIKPPKNLIDPKNNGDFAGLMELCDIVLVDDEEKKLLFMNPATRKNDIENHEEKVNSIVEGIQNRAFSKMREYDGKKAKQTKPTLATGKRYLKYKKNKNATKRARTGI